MKNRDGRTADSEAPQGEPGVGELQATLASHLPDRDPRLARQCRKLTSASAALSVATGAAGLVGWKLQIYALTTWGAEPVTMKANTALCFVLLGASLWLLREKENQPLRPAIRAAAAFPTIVAGTVGLLSLIETIFARNFGIDELLVVAPTRPVADAPGPGLMSPITASCFGLLTLALLGIDWKTRRGRWPAQYFSLISGLAATSALLGFAFDPHFYAGKKSLALPTTVAMLALALGVATARPERGLGSLLSRRDLSGSLARRLLPAALIPAVVGWIRWRITAAGIYSDWDVVVLASLTTLLLLAGVVAWGAAAVERSERQRRRIEQALGVGKDQMDRLLDRLEEAPSEAALRRRASAAFALAVFLTGLLGWFSLRNVQLAAREADWVAHTHEVMTTQESTLRHLDDVLASERGFSVTSHKSFLEASRVARPALARDLKALRKLIADNSSENQRLDVVEGLSNDVIGLCHDMVSRRQSLGKGPTSEELEQSRQLMDEVRGRVEDMDAEERRLLDQRGQRTHRARQFSAFLLTLGAMSGMVLLVLAGFLLSREIGVSARARANIAALLPDLERRVAERTAALSESEGRLAGVIQSAMDAIITVDGEQRIVLFNAAAERVFRLPMEQAVGQPLDRLIPERFRAAHASHLRRFGESGVTNRGMGTPDELWGLRADGVEFPVEASISQVEAAGRKLFTVILRDVTDRKSVAEALRASEERLRLAVEGARLGTWHWDLETGNLEWSSGCLAMFGLPPGAAMSYAVFLAALHPEDRMAVDEAVQRSLAQRSEYDIEFRTVWRDSSEHWIAARGRGYYTPEGQAVRMEGVVMDVTERRQSQERLRDSENFLQSTLDALSSHIAILDDAGTIIAVNSAWHRFAANNGGDPNLCNVGCNYLQVCRKVAQEAAEAGAALAGIDQVACGEREEFSMEYPCHSPDEKRWFTMRVTPLANQGHGRVVLAHENITGLKLAEQQLLGQAEELSRQADELIRAREAQQDQTRMLQLVLDNMGEGLVAADLQGRFMLWNDSASKLLSRTAANLPPEQWSSHYACYLPDGITPCPTDRLPLVRALRGEPAQMELIIQHADTKARFWLEFTGRPVHDAQGNLRGGVVVFRDVSERKRAEQEIRALNQDLERRVLERTCQLQAANQELEAFTYSVSHDLRAPLRHISGFSQILAEEFGAGLPTDAQRHLERIQNGTRRMGLLVDDLLNLARLGRRGLSLRHTELNPLIEEVLAELAPEYANRQVEFRIATLPPVECDPGLIKQVFQNLLANALKFTRLRAPAVIEVGRKDADGVPVVFLRDNGVGFNMKYIDKLFGVFQRLHRQEDFEGTGVGLATVQRIMKKHGGRIWAEAELDKGATFYFSFGVPAKDERKTKSAGAGESR